MKTAASMLISLSVVGVVGCVADTTPDTAQRSSQMQALLEEFPEATQIDDHSIGWDDGRVVLALPENSAGERSAEEHGVDPAPVVSLSPALVDAHGCPSGWYCVYQDINWGGRRLQFSDCTRNDLGNFGFRDQTSSWVNNGSHTLAVRNDIPLLPDQTLWTMPAQSTSCLPMKFAISISSCPTGGAMRRRYMPISCGTTVRAGIARPRNGSTIRAATPETIRLTTTCSGTRTPTTSIT